MLLIVVLLLATAQPHGITVEVAGTHSVELAVAGISSFRVSIAYKGKPNSIDTSMVATPASFAKFSPFTSGSVQGIRTSFGSVSIDSKSGAFVMTNGANQTVTSSPSLSAFEGHGGGKGDTCKAPVPSSDANGGTRTPGCPDGLGGQTQASCCAACNSDKDCTFWVFAAADPSQGKNCWLLKDVGSRSQAGPDRVSGGTTTGGLDTVVVSLSRADAALFYGAGGSGGSPLASTSSSPYVANKAFMTPHYWSTEGYAALGVSPYPYDPSNLVHYPAAWSQGDGTTMWRIAGDHVDLYLMPATTSYDGMRTYWELTGPPAVLPRYSFGFLACRWGWQDRSYIMSILQQFRNGSYPIDAWISDFGWFTDVNDYNLPPVGSPTYHDFSYNNATFPDPVAQLKEYHSMGFRFGGIRKPRLGNSDALAMAKSKGWLIGVSADGGVTDGPGRNINYSIPEARAWYGDQHQTYLDNGVDFWWNDEGETLYFTFNDWNVAQSDFLSKAKPNQRFLSINRAFTPGMQTMGTVVWTGDISVDWNTLAQQPQTLLAWTLAGVPYVTCDIGGFNGGNDPPDLLVRWYQVGTFLGVMRVHSTKQDTPHFPFLYPADAASAMKKALELRYRLLPTAYSLAHRAFTHGKPVQRPLLMEFPEDATAVAQTTQWLLGSHVLAAPVVKEDASRSVYLPKGTWYEFESAKVHSGPTTLALSGVPLDVTPVYVRAGAILPLAPIVQYTDQLPGGPLNVHVYAGEDGEFTLVEDDGETNDYAKGVTRETKFTWDDSTKTLSWTAQQANAFPTDFTQVGVSAFFPDGSSQNANAAPLGPTGSVSFN